MDDAAIVSLLSGIEPSEGEIPKPPFMAAVPAGPVIAAGADVDAVVAWVKARGGWTHRAPVHLDPERPPLFFIVPKGHLQTQPGPPSMSPVSRGGAGPQVAGRPGVAAPAPPPAAAGPARGGFGGAASPPAAAPAHGLGGADVMAFAATSDLAAARAFYERGLGLRVTGQSPIAITFDCNGTTLRVVLVQKPVVAPYTVLGWTVSDMRATIADLTGRGIDFERVDGMEQDEDGVWNAPGGTLVAWFKDPDGNMLSLTQF
jgi:catechol 2,3-dioxygenase-like lactoylglutathione lyase family enzyme